jgi:ABC-2 type transport system ATP-binding protein
VALSVEEVHKSYGATVALAGVDLEVGPGTILGLLGPNGAGKTTLVSIVAGLRRADRGRVRVLDIDVGRRPHEAREVIGLAPQETGVYPPLTVRDNMLLFAGLAGLSRRAARDRIAEVAAALSLDHLLARRASALSGGERRRLHTAMALLHRPGLVLLDEPTTGADVRTRREILDLVRNLARDGAAVVYSTHYLQEIEALGASVAFIDDGRIVAQGELPALVHRYGSSALELSFTGDVPAVVTSLDRATVDGSSVRIETDEPSTTAAVLLRELGPDASRLRAIEVVQPSLESVFLNITGRRYAHQIEESAA